MTELEQQRMIFQTTNTLFSAMFGKLFDVLHEKGILTEAEIQEIREHAAKQAEDVSGVELLDLTRGGQADDKT